MGTKAINTERLSPTLHMSECKDGFWLYDDTRGMNLAMREKTKEEAFIKAISYYQERLKTVEWDYSLLQGRVDVFIEQLKGNSDAD